MIRSRNHVITFITFVPGVVLILMFLKLLQAKQYEIINQLPEGKAIVLNGEHSQKSVFIEIAHRHYIYVFKNPKIALF